MTDADSSSGYLLACRSPRTGACREVRQADAVLDGQHGVAAPPCHLLRVRAVTGVHHVAEAFGFASLQGLPGSRWQCTNAQAPAQLYGGLYGGLYGEPVFGEPDVRPKLHQYCTPSFIAIMQMATLTKNAAPIAYAAQPLRPVHRLPSRHASVLPLRHTLLCGRRQHFSCSASDQDQQSPAEKDVRSEVSKTKLAKGADTEVPKLGLAGTIVTWALLIVS